MRKLRLILQLTRCRLGNKSLQYTYYLISQEVLTWEILFLKNHTQNVVEKLVPDPIIEIKLEHISGLTVWNGMQFVFIVYPIGVLPKYIKTKVLTTCFGII